MMIQNVLRVGNASVEEALKKAEKVNENRTIEQQQEIVAKQKKAENQKAQKDRKDSRSEPENIVMSAVDMKELFLIMGSRGGNKPIETLAHIVKEQRKQQKLG